MRVQKATPAAFLAALLCSSAPAMAEQQVHAQLVDIHGNVLVDSGEGFVPVAFESEPQIVNLKLGDRVMVTGEGKAVLRYGPDCAIPLEAPSMTTVAETSCVVGTQNGGTNPAVLFVNLSAPVLIPFVGKLLDPVSP